MRRLYTSGGQSFGISASASLLPMHIQSSIPLGLTGLTSLQSKGLSESFPEPQFKTINSLVLGLLYGPTLTSIHDYVSKVMSLLFNMLSRLVIAFLPRSKHLSFSWLQSPSAVILEPKKIQSVTVYIVSPSICHEMMELNALILLF